MALNLNRPANRKVLRYVKRLTARESAGIHPDVLDRMIVLAGKLPQCVRRSIGGVRLIAHRKTGTIAAVAMGTSYFLRVGSAVKEAKRAGLHPSMSFADDSVLNVSRAFGRDWLFGCWNANEPKWIQRVLDAEASELAS